MANNMRWREGDTNPVNYFVDSSVSVEIGDLVYEAAGYVFPASLLGVPAGVLNTHESGIMAEFFAKHFAGVAMQASPVGSDAPVRVATSGVFEFDMGSYNVLSGGFSIGNPVRIQLAEDGSPVNQSVNLTSSPSKKIGYLWKTRTVNNGRVQVEIKVPNRPTTTVAEDLDSLDGKSYGKANWADKVRGDEVVVTLRAEVERLNTELSELSAEASLTVQVQTLAYVELQEKYSQLQDEMIKVLQDSLKAHTRVDELVPLVKKYEKLAQRSL